MFGKDEKSFLIKGRKVEVTLIKIVITVVRLNCKEKVELLSTFFQDTLLEISLSISMNSFGQNFSTGHWFP